jgi:glycerophosphoryl diester phosphodiesterase
MVAVVGGLWLLAGSRSTEDGIVLAHRGAAAVRPENTLASFDKACEDLADYVELDVQETADGHVVVMHDSDYMKIAGNPMKVWDAKLEQLNQIDIGTRFSPAYSDQRTPLLKEALRLCKGRAKVDIELKYYGHNQRLVERVIQIVEEEGMQDQVILMSLHLPFVEDLKRSRPKWTVGLLAAVAVGDLSKVPADFLALNTRSISSALVDRAHRREKMVYVWTIDHPVLMSYYLGMGVDGIITNRPGTARQVIEQLRQLSPAQRFLLSVSVRLGLVPAESSADLSEAGAYSACGAALGKAAICVWLKDGGKSGGQVVGPAWRAVCEIPTSRHQKAGLWPSCGSQANDIPQFFLADRPADSLAASNFSHLSNGLGGASKHTGCKVEEPPRIASDESFAASDFPKRGCSCIESPRLAGRSNGLKDRR